MPNLWGKAWFSAKKKGQKSLAFLTLFVVFFGLFPLELLAQATKSLGVSAPKNALILVEKSLWDSQVLRQKIERYGNDVGQTLNLQSQIVVVPPSSGVLQIQELIATSYFSGLDDQYRSLQGVVLIGDIPLPVVYKNGNHWPTIFPYVDFLEPVYVWDESKEKFVFDSRQHMKPEIWHGVIRSTEIELADQTKQLETFFDTNHQFHTGEKTVAKKVFYANFRRQREVIPPELFFRYRQWLKFSQALQYNWFTKHLVRVLQDEQKNANQSLSSTNTSEKTQRKLAQEIANSSPDITVTAALTALTTDSLSQLPDIQARQLISNLVSGYGDIYQHWLTEVYQRIGRASRWQPERIDTTPSLIARKDQLSLLRMRTLNDEIEAQFQTWLTDYLIATPLYLPASTLLSFQRPATGTEEGSEMIQVSKPLYINGKQASDSDFMAADCSLYRGTSRNQPAQLAQKIEGNRSFDINQVEHCKHVSEPGFERDPAGGCCAKNLKVNDLNFSAPDCRPSSTWENPTNQVADLYHVGATEPVYSSVGTQEAEGLVGSQACAEFWLGDNYPSDHTTKVSSLTWHQEPQPQTIKAQLTAGFSKSLPVDDPRGFSFYSHDLKFHRLSFPDIFDWKKSGLSLDDFRSQWQEHLVEKIEQLNTITQEANAISSQRFEAYKITSPFPQDSECSDQVEIEGSSVYERQVTWTQSCERTVLVTKTEPDGTTSTQTDTQKSIQTETRAYHQGKLIPLSVLESLSAEIDLAKIHEALFWLDRNIEDKNRQVFTETLNPPSQAQTFFADESQNGYEVVEIISSGSTQAGLELAFSPRQVSPDAEFEFVGTDRGSLTQSVESQTTNPSLIKNSFSALPNAAEFDAEYLKIQAAQAQLQTPSQAKPQTFLGQNLGETFLNTVAESECESIPSTLLYWPSKLACSLRATSLSSQRQVNLGKNAGTNQPFDPIIEDPTVTLNEKRLRLTLENQTRAVNDQKPIQATVEILNQDGTRSETDFSTQIRLTDLKNVGFKVLPQSTQTAQGGKAVFFLLPTDEPPQHTALWQALAVRSNSSESLKSLPQELATTAYHSFAFADKTQVPVKDQTGVVIKVDVLDKDQNLIYERDGQTLTLETKGGTFVSSGTNQAQLTIKHGRIQAQLLPDTKAGDFVVRIFDEQQVVAEDQLIVTLLPSEPASIYLSKKSKFLVKAGEFTPVVARLLDRYGNIVSHQPHRWSWQWEGLEVEDAESRDIDPRTSGLQEWSNYEGASQLLIRSAPKASQAHLKVSTDSLSNDKARQIQLTTIKDPYFDIEFEQTQSLAGSEIPLWANITAKASGGEILNDDFTAKLAVNPLPDSFVPAQVSLVDGRARIALQPGALAGRFQLEVQTPGFRPSSAHFQVVANQPVSLQIRPQTLKKSYSLKPDDPLVLEVKALDKYGNLVPNFSDNINLKATKPTAYLLDFPNQTTQLTGGKTAVSITPKGLAGRARIIVTHPELVGDGWELDLVDYWSVSDLKNIKPISLLTLLLGFESSDLRTVKNFANQYLHAGKTQAVAGLSASPRADWQYGSLSPTGSHFGSLNLTWVSGESLAFLVKDKETILSQQRLTGIPEVNLRLNPKQNQKGISLITQAPELRLTDQTLYWKNQALLQAYPTGGLRLLHPQVTLKPTDNWQNWTLYFEGLEKGHFRWNIPEVELKKVESFTQVKTPELQISSTDPTLYFAEVFVENSTVGSRGWGWFSLSRPESGSKSLGAKHFSLEHTHTQENLGWDGSWKPSSLLAAGNSIGQSTAWGSSDMLLLYGDPSLGIIKPETRNAQNIKPGLGEGIWQTPTGDIDQIISLDVNQDQHLDLAVLSQNQLWLLYKNKNQTFSFQPGVQWLRFRQGVKKLASLPRSWSENLPQDILQLDQQGRLNHWHNNGRGLMRPHQLDIGLVSGIEDFFVERLNGDTWPDLILVDDTQKIWVSYGQTTDFSPPILVGDFVPEFKPLTEKFVWGKTDLIETNLSQTLFSYGSIRVDSKISQLDWQRLIDPHQPETKTIVTTELEASFLNNYYNTGGATLSADRIFVSTDKASFLSQVSLKSHSKSNKVQPADSITMQLTITPQSPLKDLVILPPSSSKTLINETSVKCRGCREKIKVLPAPSPKHAFWAEIKTLSQPITLTWTEKITQLPTLKIFVGDFDDGADNRADILIPWQENQIDRLWKYSSKAGHTNPSWNQSPYQLTPEILPVSQPASSTDLIKSLSDTDFADRVEKLFGAESDTDADGLPYGFDSYEGVSNSQVDRQAVLGGSISNTSSLLNLGDQRKRSQMLLGGGTCFNQAQSEASKAPGLINDRQMPHARPNGQQDGQFKLSWPTTKYTSNGPVPSTSPPDSPGERSQGAPFKSVGRHYVIPTSTGKTAEVLCTGLFPIHMASPSWAPNCFVSTPPVQFMDTCDDPESYQPKTDQLLCSADSFQSGSTVLQTRGAGWGKKNSSFTRTPGPSNAPLTGINATSFQNLQSALIQNDKIGKGNTNASFTQPAPQFSRTVADNPLVAAGSKEKEQATIYSDIVRTKTVTIPIKVPRVTQAELETAKIELKTNHEKLLAETDQKIPPQVLGALTSLKQTQENLLQETLVPEIPDLKVWENWLNNYQKHLDHMKQTWLPQVCSSSKTPGCTQAQQWMSLNKDRLERIRQDLPNHHQILQETKNTLPSQRAALVKLLRTPAMQNYRQQLETLVGQRRALESHSSTFARELEKISDASLASAQRLIEIRDMENKTLAVTKQVVAQYQKYHEGWLAINQARLNAWENQQQANQQILKITQSVPQIFTEFANRCRTSNVDRGTLLPWLADTVFEKGAPRQVFTLPMTPNLNLDASKVSPAKLDLTLPIADVIPVDIGSLPTMSSLPSIPDQATPIQIMTDFSTRLTEVQYEQKSTQLALEQWEQFYQTLESQAKKLENWHPALKLQELEILPSLPNLPELPMSLPPEIDSIPRPTLTPLRLEKPPILPELSQPDLSTFSVKAPNLPVPQLPFLPPPPKMDNLARGMLDQLAIPLASLNLECGLRLGTLPVPEWYVKPHVERRTNRSSLSQNDITPQTIARAPLVTNPMMINLRPQIPRTSLFDDQVKQLETEATKREQFLESLLDGNSSTLSATSFLASLQSRAQYLPTYTQTHDQLKREILALKTLPTTLLQPDKEIEEAFHNYLARLDRYHHERQHQTQTLANLYQSAPESFFDHELVQRWIKSPNKFLASGAITSALDFSIPVRSFQTAPANFDLSEKNEDKTSTTKDIKPPLSQTPSCGNGIEPGLYYAKTGSDYPQKINELRDTQVSAYRSLDLNQDGSNELLYALGGELYLKTFKDFQDQPQKKFLQIFDSLDWHRLTRPLDKTHSKPAYQATNWEFTAGQSLGSYREWLFSPYPDQIFSTTEAPWRVGVLGAQIPKLDVVEPQASRLVETAGTPQVKAPLTIPLLLHSPHACQDQSRQPSLIQEGIVASAEVKAELWLTRPGEKAEKLVLPPRQTIALRNTYVCLASGQAEFYKFEEKAASDFWQENIPSALEKVTKEHLELTDGSQIFQTGRTAWIEKLKQGHWSNWRPATQGPLLSGTILKLKADDSVSLEFYDGTKQTLVGPQTYYFAIKAPQTKAQDLTWLSQNLLHLYSQVRRLAPGKVSYRRPQFFPIITDDQ